MTLVLLWNLPAIGEPLVEFAPPIKKRSRLAYEGRPVVGIQQYPTEMSYAQPDPLNPALVYLALEFLNE
jgi:hypothetical protein